MVAVMTIAAATSTDIFLAFIQQVLIPALRSRPEAVVAMDNLAPHRSPRTGPRRSGPHSGAPVSLIATCRPTRRT